MATAEPTTALTLIIKRTIPEPRAKVFDAWTSPELIRQWFMPGEQFTVPVAEVDLRVGGAYRIAMRPPDQGADNIVSGIYREIVKPERLVFTWTWKDQPAVMLVTLTFNDLGASTELVLKHEYLPSEDSRTRHERGWAGCLQQLEKFSTGKQ